MSQLLDLSQFPDLPPEVMKAFAAVQFELSVERAARQHEQAVVAEKEAFITELKALIEKLEGQVQDYRRAKFGPKSEKLDPAQLELALEVEPLSAIGPRTMARGNRHCRDAGPDRRCRGQDRGQRAGPGEAQAPRAAQGTCPAGRPAARRAGDRARQRRLPMRLRHHGPDR